VFSKKGERVSPSPLGEFRPEVVDELRAIDLGPLLGHEHHEQEARLALAPVARRDRTVGRIDLQAAEQSDTADAAVVDQGRRLGRTLGLYPHPLGEPLGLGRCEDGARALETRLAILAGQECEHAHRDGFDAHREGERSEKVGERAKIRYDHKHRRLLDDVLAHGDKVFDRR